MTAAIQLSVVLALVAGCHRAIYTVPPARAPFLADAGRVYARANLGVNGVGGEVAHSVDSAWRVAAGGQWVGSTLSDSNFLSSIYVDLAGGHAWRLRSGLFVSSMLIVGHGWSRCPPGRGHWLNADLGRGVGLDSGSFLRLSVQPALTRVWGEALDTAGGAEEKGLYSFSALVRITGIHAYNLKDGGIPVSNEATALLEPSAILTWGIRRYGFVVEIGTSVVFGSGLLTDWPGYLLVGLYTRF